MDPLPLCHQICRRVPIDNKVHILDVNFHPKLGTSCWSISTKHVESVFRFNWCESELRSLYESHYHQYSITLSLTICHATTTSFTHAHQITLPHSQSFSLLHSFLPSHAMNISIDSVTLSLILTISCCTKTHTFTFNFPGSPIRILCESHWAIHSHTHMPTKIFSLTQTFIYFHPPIMANSLESCWLFLYSVVGQHPVLSQTLVLQLSLKYTLSSPSLTVLPNLK